LRGYTRTLDPLPLLTLALVLMLLRAPRGGGTRNLLPWLGVAVCALLTWPGHGPPYGLASVAWFWQVVLVVSGMVLAAGPLLAEMRQRETEPHSHDVESVPVAV
jgi:hypothetical protein